MTLNNIPTLNIIGAGRLGKTLAHLWQQSGQLSTQAICNRSLESSQAAVDFIQAGQAYSDYAQLPGADAWLLACGDDQLSHCCQQLCDQHNFTGQETLFHCSGALTAQEVFSPAKKLGLSIASIHPIKSFADPQQSIKSFSGTHCGIEGDEAALQRLTPVFENIGAQLFTIKPEAKTLYHSASVIACNYLVALQELSIQTYEQAGVERVQAMQILQPIVQGTAENIFKLGTQGALTGPIARGDQQTVSKQFEALQEWSEDAAEIYRLLGKITADIAPSDAEDMIRVLDSMAPGNH
uniref:Ketopantoate reductase PanG (EC) n=1 Tax=uncultured Thiotrichaceae bacterium TaxID=298394 RepID=A0A6S6UKK8_9GAMM|nr:MAG: Ketopantoate reductase PanG (EC [uncultured Thiotrichaceae bacterium]